MNCQQSKPFIGPYADRELDAAGTLELEQHLQGCPACTLEVRNMQSLKKAVKNDSLFFTAPPELRRRVKVELRSQLKIEPWWKVWRWNGLSVATSGMAAACLALLLTVVLSRDSSRQRLPEEIVSSHVRSLMAEHALDVASTDQHTVKPWFNGKIDFSPPVKDLAAQGFPLVGGRLDYLEGRSVAALVFHRQKHVINLFIWPAEEKTMNPTLLAPIHGYHLIHWSEAGLVFWAASDLNEKELMEFVQDFVTGN